MKKFEELQKCEPDKLSKSAFLSFLAEKEIEAAKDDYSGDNIAHYCVSNSHIAILCKIISLDPSIVQRGNDQGNLPLHLLCLNTQAGKKELRYML